MRPTHCGAETGGGRGRGRGGRVLPAKLEENLMVGLIFLYLCLLSLLHARQAFSLIAF